MRLLRFFVQRYEFTVAKYARFKPLVVKSRFVAAYDRMEAPQWVYLNYKGKKTEQSPSPVFLHSCTQIGGKFVVFGGCNGNGEAEGSLLLYDSSSFLWHSAPMDADSFQEDFPGPRYGHSACLVDNHPPRLMVYGGLVGGDAYEFDAPNGLDGQQEADNSGGQGMYGGISGANDTSSSDSAGPRPSWFRRRNTKKKGNKSKEEVSPQDFDDRVYFLELQKDKWVWSKPLVLDINKNKNKNKNDKPNARTEHSCSKIGTNEVAIFGGWTEGDKKGPSKELWAFDTNAMTWRVIVASGIQPRERYRHSSECVGSKLYICGGSDNGSDCAARAMHVLGVSVLDLDANEWTHPEINGESPFPRSAHSSAMVGSMTMAIFGGRRSDEEVFNDMYMLDLTTMTSTRVRALDSQLPSPVANASMCAVGKRVFVFGGTDPKGYCFNDIRILDVGDYMNATDTTVGAGAESEFRFKILIIGDSAVGKSALLARFTQNVFLDEDCATTTVGIDYSSSMIMVDKAVCRLEMWDTAGQERFATMTANYYRGAQGALIVYDVSSRESFERAQVWFDRAKDLGGKDICPILVGNKIDLATSATGDLLNTGDAGNGRSGRQVSREEGHDFAAALGIPFVETSAKDGSNVEEAFVALTRAIKRSLEARGLVGLAHENMNTTGGVSLSKGEHRRSQCC